ncbi:hypothetical protein [Fluviicola taffensis]|uniref:Uncharacterized protein n=1 Tax=Fluviicola taffensis (strain DSM 16823 / NCIMB 13979 / RW262) TaxID=755732 RepID=F2IE59_FLUTR|nr:hypothetical protein [Fluviicola taffensis]AEA42377.1 hypothetical protein Fluta_0369 [Fluviicola taffensis DSM 16823]
MGHLRASKDSKSKNSGTVIEVVASVENYRDKLYKPISDFSWKNASPAEIHSESLPHYAKRFAI